MQREIETLKNILGVEPLEEEKSSEKAFHIKKDKDLNLIKLENLLIQNACVSFVVIQSTFQIGVLKNFLMRMLTKST